MLTEKYQKAKNLSEAIAGDVGMPRFYIERAEAVTYSRLLFDAEAMVEESAQIVRNRGDMIGHGLSHVQKVAVDVGALILIEGATLADTAGLKRLVLLAHLAGILHDIRRSEKNHAQLGAEEAGQLLKTFALTDRECLTITHAIGNHEAFQPASLLDNPADQLISDALYDADKFRWGPDNFTETLWAMVSPRNIPLDALMSRFLSGLEGVQRIRDTFRTSTGKQYGPDFIDRGMEIGRRLYAGLTEHKKD